MTATAGGPLIEPALARRLERLTLVTRRRIVGSGQGDRRSRRRGTSVEFADYRHYVPGDDPARVDWNVYARSDSLFVRVYEEEDVLTTHLVIDASRSMDWGDPNKLLTACRLAAGLAFVALSSHTRVTIWPVGADASPFGPAWGRARMGEALAYLEHLVATPHAQPPLPAAGAAPGPPDLERQLGAYRGRGAGLTVLVSDLLSPTWEQSLTRVARQSGDAVLLHVLAPDELRPRLGGDVRLIDRETGAEVALTLNADAIRIYGQRLAAWRSAVEAACTRRGILYVPVDSATPTGEVLLEQLRKRGVVQ